MYTVSLNSIRFRLLIITFACLPLLGLLLGSVLSRSGLTQTDESGAQATPPVLVASELLPPPYLPMMTSDAQLAADELTPDTSNLCAEMYRIPDSALCTHLPDKSIPSIDRHRPTLLVADQEPAATSIVQWRWR